MSFTRSVPRVMHPIAPSCVPIESTQAVCKRRRRGLLNAGVLRRVWIPCTATAGMLFWVLWLWSEVPHPIAAMASHESPLVEARSLRPHLEMAEQHRLTAFAVQKDALLTSRESPPPARIVVEATPLPVWLSKSDSETVERLRQILRERGARRMGVAVRFAMLNLAELLGMTESTWAASMATPAASENEASALLLTFYLRHLDRAGDGSGMKAFRAALDDHIPQMRAVEQYILAGRSVAELEAEMHRLYLRVGIDLQFTRRGGAVFQP